MTPRRWLLQVNPKLSSAISDGIGERWITDLSELTALRPLAEDVSFRDVFLASKREAKVRFANWLKSASGQDAAESQPDCFTHGPDMPAACPARDVFK